MLLDKLTIGSSIESIVYAFVTDSYFLPTLSFGPMFYEDLSSKILLTNRKDFTWSRLQLSMALSGKLLNYDNIQSIKVTENLVKISSELGLHKYEFEVCDVFDPTGVQLDNNIVQHRDMLYKVYDDFEISNLGGKHKYLEPKESDDDLATQIHYYTSDRVDGANYVTDCVSQSRLTKEQLNDINYSDSIVRFAVSRHLTSIGIHGTFMNRYKSGKPKFRKPKIVHKKRVVLPQEMNRYEDSQSIRFLNLSIKEIIDGTSTKRS